MSKSLHIPTDDICCPSFVHQCCFSIIEGHQVGLAQSALGEAVLTVLTPHLACALTGGSAPWSSQTQSRSSPACSSPGLSFYLFLKMGVMFSFLQSPGTLPDSNYFSMESGLANTSASSFRTLGCMSSGSINLYTLSLMKQSWIYLALTVGGIFVLGATFLHSICSLCHLNKSIHGRF